MIDVWTVCWRAPLDKHNDRAMISLNQLKTNANARPLMLFCVVTTCVEMKPLPVPLVWIFRLLDSTCIYRNSGMWFEVTVFIKPYKHFISFHTIFWASSKLIFFRMRDYFRSRSTTQLPSTEYNFRQHLLHHNTSFIAFSVNELKRHHLERHPQPMKANTPLIQINFHSIFIQIVEQDMVWENARCTARHVTIVRDNIISWACAGRKRKYMGQCQPEKSMIVSLRYL